MKNIEILAAHGWTKQPNNNLWKHPKRPNEEIMLGPTEWVHTTADINAPEGRRAISHGTNADLKAYLEPELNLTCDVTGVPVAGKCSCGAEMDRGVARTVTGKVEVNKWFKQQFKRHIATSHPAD